MKTLELLHPVELVVNDLLEAINLRMSRLQDYTNSRELNELEYLKENIEFGMFYIKKASWFLAKVPEGEYDVNRRKYTYRTNYESL